MKKIISLLLVFFASYTLVMSSFAAQSEQVESIEIGPKEYIKIYCEIPADKQDYYTYIDYVAPDGTIITHFRAPGYYHLDKTAQFLYTIGAYFLMEEKHTPASRLLQASLNLKNETSQVYTNLGYAYIKNKNYSQAITVSQAGLQIFPDDQNIWANYLDALNKSGRESEAFKVAIQVRGIINTNAYLLNDCLEVLIKNQAYSEAEIVFNQFVARKASPFPKTLVTLYKAYFKAKLPHKAKLLKKQAATIYGKNPTRHHFYASLLASEGKKADALKQLKIASNKGYQPKRQVIAEDIYLRAIFTWDELSFLL